MKSTFLLLALAAACAPVASVRTEPTYAVEHETDEFTKSVRSDMQLLNTRTYETDLDCGTHRATLVLSLAKVQGPSSSEPAVALAVGYLGDKWLFIRRNAGLLVLAGDSTLTLSAPTEGSRTVGRSTVSEAMAFQVSKAQLQEIARASHVRIRVAGSAGRCEVTLAPGAPAAIAQFVETELR